MFTGIVEATGTVVDRAASDGGVRLTIEPPWDEALAAGSSVAVNGVCLTAETVGEGTFEVFLAEETRGVTYLDRLEAGDRVNLERPRPVGGRLDGHLVQGHVDDTIDVLDRRRAGEDVRMGFALPAALAPYVVQKGSVTIDGISLTVADRQPGRFEVAIIPETLARTTIDEKTAGDPVHLEVDLIARYVERLLADR